MSAFTIPQPRLRTVRNGTPFALFQCDKMGVGRRFFDTVVLKGTYVLAPGRLALAEQQADFVMADDVWDPEHAERSSLRAAGEVVLTKPTTDVIVTGTARAPGGKPLPAWDAAVEVRRGGETVLVHRAQALGPRRFRHAEGGWGVTEPEPTAEVPIRYELAYGGAYLAPPEEGAPTPAEPTWVVHHPNPSGLGFCDERALDPAREYRAPQWQSREHPVTGPNRAVPLAGFGPVARPWTSRLEYAGTYDDAWIQRTRDEVKQGLPSDYAADFDARFFQCAHPGLIAPSYLAGDEEIVLTGLLAGAEPLRLELPGVEVVATMFDGEGGAYRDSLDLDTVHLDLDAGTVSLCWRITLDQALGIETATFTIKEGA